MGHLVSICSLEIELVLIYFNLAYGYSIPHDHYWGKLEIYKNNKRPSFSFSNIKPVFEEISFILAVEKIQNFLQSNTKITYSCKLYFQLVTLFNQVEYRLNTIFNKASCRTVRNFQGGIICEYFLVGWHCCWHYWPLPSPASNYTDK